jgi:hypothetical protein
MRRTSNDVGGGPPRRLPDERAMQPNHHPVSDHGALELAAHSRHPEQLPRSCPQCRRDHAGHAAGIMSRIGLPVTELPGAARSICKVEETNPADQGSRRSPEST